MGRARRVLADWKQKEKAVSSSTRDDWHDSHTMMHILHLRVLRQKRGWPRDAMEDGVDLLSLT